MHCSASLELYESLTFRNDALDAVFIEAERLCAPKAIYFKLDSTLPQNAATREFTDFWLVWIKVQSPEKAGHELAHIIFELRNQTPVLDPDQPSGPSREFLGNVIGLLDHPGVHAILREAGLDDLGESRRALAAYLNEADTVSFEDGKTRPFMAVGFANMSLTHSNGDPSTFKKIVQVLGERSPETLASGTRITRLVESQRDDQPPDVIARRSCDVLSIRKDFRDAIWPWDRKVLRPYIT